MAIDIHLRERTVADLHAAAVDLGGGGVGYYPTPGFVHVDVGPVRYWEGAPGNAGGIGAIEYPQRTRVAPGGSGSPPALSDLRGGTGLARE